VLKIPLPIPVECKFAILVVVVPKRKKGVLNVPVVTLVKRVLVRVVLANNVRLVNFVPPMMIRPILVRVAILDIIKKIRAKLLVYPAYQELIKKILDQQRVLLVAKDSTKVWPVMIPV
jgi:hypothetical protein